VVVEFRHWHETRKTAACKAAAFVEKCRWRSSDLITVACKAAAWVEISGSKSYAAAASFSPRQRMQCGGCS
jgi:hypothetical protein